MNMPQISVVMPIYNSEKYVAEAISSLLSQTFTDFEIIAINDGSKDNSSKVVSSISDERLIFIDDPENHGFLPTLNRGISMARGKYIARLDDDDISYPTRLEKQFEYMEAHQDVVLCGTHYDQIINGNIQPRTYGPFETDEQVAFSLAFGNFVIPHSSFMMRKDILTENNIQYEMFLQVPDYHMLTVMSKYGRIHFIKDTLVSYRVYPEQSTAVRSKKMVWGEIDRSRLWYIHRLLISDRDKEILCKAATRCLSTTDDYKLYVDAVERYAATCGLNNSENDKKCVSIVLQTDFERQKRTPKLLGAFIRAKKLKYAVGMKWNQYFRCLCRYSPDYIDSDYKAYDDGSVDKHSI